MSIARMGEEEREEMEAWFIFRESSSLSSSSHNDSMDFTDPLLPSIPIIHRFWLVLFAASSARTELKYVHGAFNKFPDFFFVLAFKIVDSWKFTILLLYILWDDWPIFMISDLNEQLQKQLEYILLKPDCHSWWISKVQSGREDTLEERYAIKLSFKLEKMSQKRMECFRLLLEHLACSKIQGSQGLCEGWWEVWEE